MPFIWLGRRPSTKALRQAVDILAMLRRDIFPRTETGVIDKEAKRRVEFYFVDIANHAWRRRPSLRDLSRDHYPAWIGRSARKAMTTRVAIEMAMEEIPPPLQLSWIEPAAIEVMYVLLAVVFRIDETAAAELAKRGFTTENLTEAGWPRAEFEIPPQLN